MIRPLTNQERAIWGKAVARAVSAIPSFRPAISACVAFMDDKCQTAYIDPHCRVGLSPNFFENYNDAKQATVALHECAHFLFNHFSRYTALGMEYPEKILNIAADFEINSVLQNIAGLDLGQMVHPSNLGLSSNQTMEYYYYELKKMSKEDLTKSKIGNLVQDQGQGQSQESGQGQGQIKGEDQSQDQGNGQGQGQGQEKENKDSGPSVCDSVDEEKIKEIDEEGIPRRSDSEKNVISEKSRALAEEASRQAKQCGKGTESQLIDLLLSKMRPPKADWRKILKSICARRASAFINGNKVNDMKRPHRRKGMVDYCDSSGKIVGHDEFFFPSMRAYAPKVLFAIDTSGSMYDEELIASLNEADDIIRKSASHNVTIATIDEKVQTVQKVSNIKDVKIQGRGGTDLTPLFDYIDEQKVENRPDIVVVATDGEFAVDHFFRCMEKSCNDFKLVMLMTTNYGKIKLSKMPQSVKRRTTFIDATVDDRR